ncbi:hypothetical protein F5I97DRAFT_1889097 [Phlebopus sp. FC_14]|nr:hypothetical protein F5I97DRAFT_1889097 [Phlebopus sp. FC_14]
MSVNIVLPTLSAWATGGLSSLLQSTTETAFDTTFDAIFAHNVNVTLNGKQISRDEYKAELLTQSGAAPLRADASVNVEGQLEVPGDQGQLSGIVGIFYTSLTDSKYLILGAPAESRTTSSINLTIEPTEKNPQSNLHIHGYFDPRRVVTVNQVVAETSFHTTIPASSVPKGTEPSTSSGKIELGPGPVKLPPQSPAQQRPFGGNFGPGPVKLPLSETGARPETLPGDGEFGVGPVVIPGETIGEIKNA